MMEPLFGSSPLPTGVASPGMGWFQLPLSLGGRPTIGSGTFTAVPNVTLAPPPIAQPLPQDLFGYNAAVPSGFVGPGVGGATLGIAAGIPGVGMADGGTVRALLAMVAMRRGQPMGPTNDNEIEDFIYDALEFVPGSNEIEVRCEGGRATLTGNVPQKRLKHDVGEIVWAIPVINDVQNNLTITARRRRAQTREAEPSQAPARKQG